MILSVQNYFSKCHKTVNFKPKKLVRISPDAHKNLKKWQNTFFDLTSTGMCRGENEYLT